MTPQKAEVRAEVRRAAPAKDRQHWILRALWTAENNVDRLIVAVAAGAWVYVGWLLLSGR